MGDYAANVEVSRQLTSHTIKLAQRSGFPFFLYSSKLQQGSTFGERISSACQDLFTRGFEKLLVIGNDTTSLTSRDLTEAADRIHNQRVSLGPSSDGGLYLLGITKRHFDSGMLSNVRWESNFLFEDLRSKANRGGLSIFLLARKSDLDNRRDFRLFIKSSASKSLIGRKLLRISGSDSSVFSADQRFTFTSFVLQTTSLRAPPLAS